jgi:hypothetical protein
MEPTFAASLHVGRIAQALQYRLDNAPSEDEGAGADAARF